MFESESDAEENLVATVHAVVQCLSRRNEVLSNLVRCLGKLVTSTLPAQRAVTVAFYAELIGKLSCDAIWLDAIINTLHEAKTDSSPLVRKLATIGLTRVACLEPKQVRFEFIVRPFQNECSLGSQYTNSDGKTISSQKKFL